MHFYPCQDADLLEVREQLSEEALKLLRQVGDKRGVADEDEARVLLEESLAVCETIGDTRGIALSLDRLGCLAAYKGNVGEGGRRSQQVRCLQLCAQLACEESDWERKARYLEQSVPLARESGNLSLLCTSLDLLIDVLRHQGNDESADTFARERKTLHDPCEMSDDVSARIQAAFDSGDRETVMSAVRKLIFGAAN